MLDKMGFANLISDHDTRYPQLDQTAMQQPDTFYLFSSEPYPFLRHQPWLIEQGFNGAIVDGEVYSWFGIRSYRALEKYLQKC